MAIYYDKMQKHRIYTNIGKDQKITVDLKQDFDLLEVLSLKLTQEDIYTSVCADYGVVCGRVLVNKGFGVPNAKVSIFVPLSTEDENDPVISALYPYKTVNDANENGYKYNLLPSRQQHGGHNPTGTFPDQSDIVTREEVLVVYEKYYKYTVKTNDAGDFMIWGVPLGQQTIHVDLDISDMGCFSLRPDDFLKKGYGVDDFKSTYEFKSDPNIESLPQIVSFDKTIEVYPFFGGEDLCQIGITRIDFDLSEKGIIIQPKALIIGGTFTDTGKGSVSKFCVPRINMGDKCSLSSESGKIEAIRFSNVYDEQNRPFLEQYNINEDISDDGAFAFGVPMNRDFVYTDEFGEKQYTNDSNKGIATSACYRFRFSIKDAGTERQRMRASYLAPNIREFYTDGDDSESEKLKSYAWSVNYDDYPVNAVDDYILATQDGIYTPQDFFYRFEYNKVYTVSSFQNAIFSSNLLATATLGSILGTTFLGIKNISPSENNDCADSIVTPPTNFATRNYGNFQTLMGIALAQIQLVIFSIILVGFEFLGTLFNGIAQFFNFQIPLTNYRPLARVYEYLKNAARLIQSAGQITLPLTIYDDCELCPINEETVNRGYDLSDYCKIAEFKFNVVSGGTDETQFKIVNLYESSTASSNYTDGSHQRDCDPLSLEISGCCDSYLISSSGYADLNNLTWTGATGNTLPRFYIAIGGNTQSPLGEASFFIHSGATITGNEFKLEEITTGVFGFKFNNSQITDLFGIENADTYFATNPITGSTLYAYVIDRKYRKSAPIEALATPQEGCEMYDKLYNEDTIVDYLWFSGTTTYGDPWDPIDNITIKELPKGTEPSPLNGWTIGASVWYRNINDKLPREQSFNKIPDQTYNKKTKSGFSEFRDGVFIIVPSITGVSSKNARALLEWYKRTIVALNFCGGIVNYAFIDNWLSGALYFFQFKAKVKIKEKNRLNITVQNFNLYFNVDTTKRIKVKACDAIVKYVPDHGRFYYRSCPYDANPLIPENDTRKWGWEITSAPVHKKILHPTTFVDLGARDEFIKQICIDPVLDSNCSVSRSIGPTSFKSFGELVAFAINYRMDATNGDTNTNDFFSNGGFKTSLRFGVYFDGDIMQLISINNEAGIEEFDLQNAKYVGYNLTTLDPDEENTKNVFKNFTQVYGPTPITMQYNDDGVRIRQCLNTPEYLGGASQRVPFFLWDKKGTGFGAYSAMTFDNQSWDYENIQVQPLQGMSYGYKFNTSNSSDTDKYLLPPISYDFSGVTITGPYLGLTEEFDIVILKSELAVGVTAIQMKELFATQPHGFSMLIATGADDTEEDPTEGELYIRLGDSGNWTNKINWYNNSISGSTDYSIYKTLDPYSDRKQILSTPFLFYFGLRPGKTGLDKLIERFGPKGAFPFEE